MVSIDPAWCTLIVPVLLLASVPVWYVLGMLGFVVALTIIMITPPEAGG